MLLLRPLVRLLAFLLLVVLALTGAAVAVAAVDVGWATDLARTGQLRDTVGSWFDALAADGPIAVASALAGLGAVVLGILLLAGLLVPRRERLVELETSAEGSILARRRPLAQVAGALTEQVRGVSGVRSKVKVPRRGGGRLQVRADRPRTAEAGPTREAVTAKLDELTDPFKLKARVQTRTGPDGKRVQ